MSEGSHHPDDEDRPLSRPNSHPSPRESKSIPSRSSSARRTHRSNDERPLERENTAEKEPPKRLLLVSSKIRNIVSLQSALLHSVLLVQYKYETATLDGILSLILQHLGGNKVYSIALVLHGSGSALHISGKDEKVISKESVRDVPVQKFLLSLADDVINVNRKGSRIDILACPISDMDIIARSMESLLKMAIGYSKDISGYDIKPQVTSDDGNNYSCIGEMYFRMEKLRSWSGSNQQTLAGFEKIRLVGKGAYGSAVLYKKKDDDSLVILKEINLHDLNASERQLALNEVKVLAMLDHPNIISYYDSFEEDGTVMIEMEYADGGTLSQFLSQLETELEEKDILVMFQQIIAAIKYVHERNILHRDIKTANIFLTKERQVKMGDFGISKLLSTANKGANTVLGTPYYISPEMCEGKPYDEKSDIWALGCVLYEMACRQKTFEGSNLPALVNKIMKGQFAPVKGNYSQEFKDLVQEMLQRDPDNRPSASELWNDRIPELMTRFDDPMTDWEDDSQLSARRRKTSPQKLEKRSVLYYFEMCSTRLHPIELSSKMKIRDVAVGNDHVIVVTTERMVYSWGEGGQGQLGHGTFESTPKPQFIEALREKSIIKACCGNGFSAFSSDNGIIMTCGDGSFGVLGHGDWCSTSRPRLIEALLSVDVVALAAGDQHLAAVGSDGEVYTWGCGGSGRLGLGHEENQCLPIEVSSLDMESLVVRDVRCSHDATMLLTVVGSVLASGSNRYNKLGLNERQGFLMSMKHIFNKTEVEGVKMFTLVKAVSRRRVVEVVMGPNHTAFGVESGQIYMLGRNAEGQLGVGHTKEQTVPLSIRLFEEKSAFSVKCGEYYTVAGTTDNVLYFWGMRFRNSPWLDDSLNGQSMTSDNQLRVNAASPSRPSHSRQNSNVSINSNSGISAGGADPVKKASEQQHQPSSDILNNSHSSAQNKSLNKSLGGFRPISSKTRKRQLNSGSHSGNEDKGEIFPQPFPLLRMDSSGSQSPSGESVTLSKFYCHGENLFIEVETTAPPPKRKTKRKRFQRRQFESPNLEVPDGRLQMSASSRDGGDEYSSETSEFDTYGTIPAWIKNELAQSIEGNKHDKKTKVRGLDDSMSSITINEDFKRASSGKHSSKSSPEKHETKNIKHEKRDDRTSAESGIDDQLSSTSGSDNEQPENSVKEEHLYKKNSNTTRKVQAPPPFKSKLGPSPSQKPLSRLRSQKSRLRNSDPVKDDHHNKTQDELSKEEMQKLKADFERLKEENRQKEARLKKLEREQVEEQERIKEQAERKASEREKILKSEIHNLRSDLDQQNQILHNNDRKVHDLQLRLDQLMSDKESKSLSRSQQSNQKESKICTLQ